uniref:Pygopus homolog 1 n=1 Tax=Geotrypetes seraphini TaxID=260995 RepID=A0A6P8NI82_GEOSA|nr:pygopus homolog 1 [Geotrypetes seraphini]XP_033775638.1 pygopus homolog 1 [Geotrypetes seraphini]
MSSEQDKDPIGLKRARGGDGGLDGLGGSSIHLGSPDKKKRKSNIQVSPFPPLSEYAPPPNPSSDHLVAANPFDDNYTTSYKPLPSGNPYFSNPGYPGVGGYNTFRMAPRMSSPYRGPYSLRNPPHPFSHNPGGMGFNRPSNFNFGPHENSTFGNQSMFNSSIGQNVNMPGHYFRPSPGENYNPMLAQHSNQTSNSDMASSFGPSNNLNFNPQLESNYSFIQSQSTYNQPRVSTQKQDFNQGTNKTFNQNSTTQQRCHNSEDVNQDNADLKNMNRSNAVNQDNTHPNSADNVNGSHSNGTRNKSHLPRSTAERITSEKSNKMPLHHSRRGHSSSDPVYPCGICTNEVNDDQDAILCEASCQKWFHRICTGMTETAYGLLTAEASAVWGCDTCMSNKDVQLMRTRETTMSSTLNIDG